MKRALFGSPPGLHRFSFKTDRVPVQSKTTSPELTSGLRVDRMWSEWNREVGALKKHLAKRSVMGRGAAFSGLLILTVSILGFSHVPAGPVAGELRVTYLVSIF